MNPAIIRFTTPSGNQSPHFEDAPTSDVKATELRHKVATELKALFTEASQRNNDWWRTLESIKDTLAGLQRTCEGASDKLTENQSTSAAAVSELVEEFVAAATSDREAAVQRARSAAQVEMARLQGLIGDLQAESQIDRDKLKTAREEIDAERGLRVRAEAACQGAREVCEQTASRFQAQLQAMHIELETEKAERAKLVAALQTVQRAVSFAEPIDPTPKPTRPLVPRSPSEDRESAHTTRTIEPAPPANSPLELVDNTSVSEAQADPDLIEYAKQLLDEIEVLYWADLDARRQPADVVDRLIANLRYAHDAYARRCDSAAIGETTLFERHMTKLLDTKSETSFGRHLAVAAYECATSSNSPTTARAEAS